MQYVIEVSGLTKSFSDVLAVDNISFDVKKGQCFGLLGPNGAGKTTTIEMLEGIVEPSKGSICYFGEPISKAALARVGIQFQNTALQSYLTCRDTLKLFSSFYDDPVCQDELIEICQLGDFIDRFHSKLSGGQKQRLLLALALINNPEVIFLDEPTTGLDPHARRLFWDLINRIKSQGKTIVLTTHYMDEAEFLCDEIVIMAQGQIIERGNPQSLLSQHFSDALIRISPQTLPAPISTDYDWLKSEMYYETSTQDIEATLSQLTQANVSLKGMHIKSANLDDLFMKLTGQKLEEEA
ncbi:ABC transporter ATP-binding protein [Alteromonas sp. a30]|uniref:ABC transporter ATP-binding protein n=1 Tax=Alteromonas sp. a30 TaxID=2730917 RepID=UPI0022815ABC|nr:ABC transporter ATP-binding protein [Alteromonas sp. a30]MCY7296115.1 ABC transporter ATP-binding protein [Alteromonas sp. a30]